MLQIAKGLTKHTIVLVVDKRERAIGMQSVLQKMNFKVVVALSLYDALRSIAQEMPHLVICEALLSDGGVGSMFDRLQQHPVLKRTPILVHVLKKTKAEIAAVGQRKFAGFVLGKLENKAFAAKVMQVINAHAQVSPHFISAKDFKSDAMVSVAANVVGRKGDFMVSRSHVQLDAKASLVCKPVDAKLLPAMVRLPSNLIDAEGNMNLFPINRIIGAGRQWIEKLPDLDEHDQNAEPSSKVVIFYDPSEERFKQFEEILSGYDIQLLYAPSLTRAASLLKRNLDGIGCVYLHELLSDGAAIEWKKTFASLPDAVRPPVVIGTTSQNACAKDGLSYIKRPFGLGVFVETLESSFERTEDLSAKIEKQGYVGVDVQFKAPATLVGVDETGGILELKFPVAPGCKIDLENMVLKQAWEGNMSVKAISVHTAPGKDHTWQVRFESGLAATSNKSKYWEKVSKTLKEASSKNAAIPVPNKSA